MINFTSVRFKNFGSFGNYFTTIDFTGNPMTLVSGSNGHGKSYALLDSITFTLFGKPFRKINIPQLVNTINNKDCVTEVNFNIGSDNYKVIRGLKPKKFEIYKNDELLKQNAKSKDYQKLLEEQILKMNYKSFTQIVTLGSSSFIPFMQLSAIDRRQVIEDILDINIFSTMNMIIKAKLSMVKDNLSNHDKKIEIIKEKLKIQKENIFTLSKKRNENIQNEYKKINEIQERIKQLLSDVENLKKTTQTLDENKNKKIKLSTTSQKYQELINQLIRKKKEISDNLTFFNETVSCPTCKQDLSEDLKESNVNILTNKTNEIESGLVELKESYSNIKTDILTVDKNIQQIEEVILKINEKTNSIDAAHKYMESLKFNMNNQDSFDESIMDAENKQCEYNNELKLITEKYSDIKENKHTLDILSMLLKDSGIKAKIIKNYLPVMNEIINKYLNQMNFFVSFTLDDEFNEEIKSRHRDTFSYMNFSEGEKSRIDLAILLAWREIAKLKNSAHCNLLILDEIFDSSLDSVGVDDLMKVLRILSDNNNIFVITHKSDQLSDRFNKTIFFKKKNNFSRIK
jgi:DNA repair exonuclease SbcCD ATPase subunit